MSTLSDEGRWLHLLRRRDGALAVVCSIPFQGRLAVAHHRVIVGGKKSIVVLGAGERELRLLAELPEPFDYFMTHADGEVRAYGERGTFAVRGTLAAWKRALGPGGSVDRAPPYEGVTA